MSLLGFLRGDYERSSVDLLAHRKNDFAEGSKIFLDTDLKLILLES